MQDFSHKKILLGVCGGVAAYKAALVVRELTKRGAQVRVVMTASAQKFISPLTMQALSGHEVRTEIFDANAERAMGHIELARWADCILIAPASANTIAKIAHGIADDLLSTLCLVSESPVVICPAMNRSMWAHKATQENCQRLKKRGIIFFGPEDGSQACGEIGLGRLADIDNIVNALHMVKIRSNLEGYHFVITAGPTREAIDPVRYISNYSSGKMGYALAQAASMAGAHVTLISGPSTLTPAPGIEFIATENAESMLEAVEKNIQKNTIFIGTAAVADYKVEQIAAEKIKKQGNNVTLKLTQNPDILAQVAKSKKARYVVGFAAETHDLLHHATQKLQQKKTDMMIANLVGAEQGFNKEFNEVSILTPQQQIALPLAHKSALAAQIIEIIATNLQNAQTLITA